jgi:hypothetical protein
VFLVVRRAAGAIASPLPPLPLVATASLLVVWALLIQLAWRSPQRVVAGESRSPDALFTFWPPLLTILLFAAACSYPGGRWADWLVWPAAIAALVWSSRAVRPARRSSPAGARDVTGDDQVLQQLTRFRTSEGNEAVRGTVVAEFAAGQRDATLYVAFCPPFERLPDIETDVADGFPVAVKVAQRLHNGTQLDVRLAEPAEESLAVTVVFFAVEPDRPLAG